MPKYQTLHIFNAGNEKFSVGFFEFLQDHNFDLSGHTLFHYGKNSDAFDHLDMKVVHGSLFSVTANMILLKMLMKHDRVIIHSLASPWLLFYLYLFPSLPEKSWWIMWGKDLYFYQLLEKKNFLHKIYEFFRKRVFRKIAHLVTSTTGDYELALEWYKVKGKHHKCMMYPNNLYQDIKVQGSPRSYLNIQVGNSADPSNNHFEIFDQLVAIDNKSFRVIVPLSYGDNEYAKRVVERGKMLFGDRFMPLLSMMPREDYQQFLADIDIAIFNHKRQQALGNIISLLGLGKKVYMRSDSTHWDVFKAHNIVLYDVLSGIDIELPSKESVEKNRENTKAAFSVDTYLRELQVVLEGN